MTAPPSPDKNLQLNSMAVVASSALTSILGLAFWAIAAKLFPADEVGIAAAATSSAMMLSTLASLSLGGMYERFLSVAGHRAGTLVLRGCLLVTVVAATLAVGLIVLGPRHSLFASRWEMAAYPAFAVVLTVFALQDSISAGLGVARWGAAKNAAQAGAKIIGMIVFATAGGTVAIAGSWGVTALIAACWLAMAIARRLRTDAHHSLAPGLPPRRELLQYFAASYSITALTAVAPLVVPLIVIAQLGPKTTAYFTMSWSIVSALYVMLSVLIGPFVAECAAHPEKIHSLLGKFSKLVGVVAMLGGLGLAFVAPMLLGLLGSEYRAQGTPLLHMAAFFMPLTVVGAVYTGLARVFRRLMLAVVTQMLATAVVICGALATARSMGVFGVALSYLLAEGLVTVILIGPLILWLRELSRGSQTPTESSLGAATVENPLGPGAFVTETAAAPAPLVAETRLSTAESDRSGADVRGVA